MNKQLLQQLEAFFTSNPNALFEEQTITLSSSNLQAFATKLGAFAKPGYWIFLEGTLGAGKTTLVQAIAKSLGTEGLVSSPTFPIVSTFPLPGSEIRQVVHIDLYRIKSIEELFFMGLEYEIDQSSLAIFEWPNMLNDSEWLRFITRSGCAQPFSVLQIRIENDPNSEELRHYAFKRYTFQP